MLPHSPSCLLPHQRQSLGPIKRGFGSQGKPGLHAHGWKQQQPAGWFAELVEHQSDRTASYTECSFHPGCRCSNAYGTPQQGSWVGGWVDGRMDGWMDGWMDGVLSSPPWRPPHLTSRRLASRHAACDTFPLTQQATVEARRREIALKRYARRERDLTAMLHLLNKSEHVRVDGKEAGAVTCG